MNERKAIRYLSLAAKAGKLVSGADDCEQTVKKGKRGLLILACDAGSSTARRAGTLASDRVRLFPCRYTKSELSAAIGRASPVSLALVTDEGLAGAFAAAHATEQEERI